MLFQLNFKSAKPVYLQLVDQVKTAIASGAIRAGDSLPSIRPLAEELRVNRNTVAKAYTELESQGVVETLAGKGCFVRSGASPYRKEVRRSRVAEALNDAVIQAHHLLLASHCPHCQDCQHSRGAVESNGRVPPSIFNVVNVGNFGDRDNALRASDRARSGTGS
jgi:GntR family transcriptional regulator